MPPNSSTTDLLRTQFAEADFRLSDGRTVASLPTEDRRQQICKAMDLVEMIEAKLINATEHIRAWQHGQRLSATLEIAYSELKPPQLKYKPSEWLWETAGTMYSIEDMSHSDLGQALCQTLHLLQIVRNGSCGLTSAFETYQV